MALRRVASIYINLLARDVGATRHFFQNLLGLRLTEQIVLGDGSEMGAWLSATNKSYDVAITNDRTGLSGRLHHFTYMMDSREDVLRAADILRDADVPIETGPHKHNIGQTFFLYCFEPGGNRFEIGAGGYLIFDSDWKPVIWTEAERALGTGVGPPDREFLSYARHATCAGVEERQRHVGIEGVDAAGWHVLHGDTTALMRGEDFPHVQLEYLRLVGGTLPRDAVDVALGVVEVMPGLGIDAA